MRQRKLDRKLLLLSCLVAFLLAPFLSRAQEKKTLRVVFVSLSWNNQLPFRVAMAKGLFREQGIAIEPIFIRGGPAAIAALVSGDVDFASIGGAQAPIRSRARGLAGPAGAEEGRPPEPVSTEEIV